MKLIRLLLLKDNLAKKKLYGKHRIPRPRPRPQPSYRPKTSRRPYPSLRPKPHPLPLDADPFTCEGKAPGYYADVNTNCEVHCYELQSLSITTSSQLLHVELALSVHTKLFQLIDWPKYLFNNRFFLESRFDYRYEIERNGC